MSTTHDYGPGKRGWGHDFGITKLWREGKRSSAYGWGEGIRKGDFLLLDNQEGQAARYKVLKVQYSANVLDMWFADLKHAPRRDP